MQVWKEKRLVQYCQQTNALARYNHELQAVALLGRPTVQGTVDILEAKYSFNNQKHRTRRAYEKLLTAEAINGQRGATTRVQLPPFMQLIQGYQTHTGVGVRRKALEQAQADFERSLASANLAYVHWIAQKWIER